MRRAVLIPGLACVLAAGCASSQELSGPSTDVQAPAGAAADQPDAVHQSAAIAVATPTPSHGGTLVVMLGTGTPNPDPERSGPGVAVVAGGRPYLVDCGPGIVRRAEAARLAGITALAMPNLSRLFITHLHSDHTIGYPDLILTPWVLDRNTPLEVYGPPGTRAMTEHILAAYAEDIDIRLHGSQPQNATGIEVNVHEIEPGTIYEDDVVKVTAFAVSHGAWEHALGFRFDTADRSIVISGDTTATDAVVTACDGCDVLVHEVYAASGLDRRTSDWQAYHRASHTSGIELGEIAARARPKLLVLYHQLLWGATEEELLAEIHRSFHGEVVFADDLDVY
jgi:ribonuclease BN (tRNA processing enzyme)